MRSLYPPCRRVVTKDASARSMPCLARSARCAIPEPQRRYDRASGRRRAESVTKLRWRPGREAPKRFVESCVCVDLVRRDQVGRDRLQGCTGTEQIKRGVPPFAGSRWLKLRTGANEMDL